MSNRTLNVPPSESNARGYARAAKSRLIPLEHVQGNGFRRRSAFLPANRLRQDKDSSKHWNILGSILPND